MSKRCPTAARPASPHTAGASNIGRENGDWVLPDPDKFISGRHCEVRCENGRSGFTTFRATAPSSTARASGFPIPTGLADGDRLRIGRYIVSVSIGDGPGAAAVQTAGGRFRSLIQRLPGEPGSAISRSFLRRPGAAKRTGADRLAGALPRHGIHLVLERAVRRAGKPGLGAALSRAVANAARFAG